MQLPPLTAILGAGRFQSEISVLAPCESNVDCAPAEIQAPSRERHSGSPSMIVLVLFLEIMKYGPPHYSDTCGVHFTVINFMSRFLCVEFDICIY